MSFLGGRLAAVEGSYFLQESKIAAAKLNHKFPDPNPNNNINVNDHHDSSLSADVLPEILRNNIPLKTTDQPNEASLTSSAKWVLHNDHELDPREFANAVNLQRSLVSLPSVTLGPKRWSLPASNYETLASTANEIRRERAPYVDPKKLKAVVEGYAVIGKAFAVATVVVFGTAALTFALASSKLELQTSNDIKKKTKDLIQPKVDGIREFLAPLKDRVENSLKIRQSGAATDADEKGFVKEISKFLHGYKEI